MKGTKEKERIEREKFFLMENLAHYPFSVTCYSLLK